ncbi:MAG: diaminopimelate decarboxylase [Pygmaiobacter massiliensis]|nr:diaminopimelate decarboxylase [Pygmaiobacter massiliensis]
MKTLPFTKQQLEEIASRWPTPFYLYDEAGIRSTAAALKDAFGWNKGFREYFAVKALPNPFILKILAEYGCGTDCASRPELLLSERCGITGEDIMFSSNDTPASEFCLARKMRAIINLDDISHIEMLEGNGGIPETVCCRYNPGSSFSMTNQIMGNLSDTKFGMTRPQLFEALRILKSKGAKRFGVHALLVSCSMDEEYYPQLAAELFRLAVEIKKELGISLSFVDLSGGIGIPYRPQERAVDIARVGGQVRQEYEKILLPAGIELAIYTELGRFMTGPHGYLVSRVIHEKHTYKNYLGLDATAANLMRPAIYGAYHHITVAGKEQLPADTLYDVTGSLCENNDKFAVDRLLPACQVGDLLVLHDAGAHGYSMGYNYNGKLRCAELLVKPDGSVQMIRRAETAKDYFATFDFTGLFDDIKD